MPTGAWNCERGAAGSGLAGMRGDWNTIEGNPTELAAEDSIAPPAPMAPRRNISLRFNDMPHPVKKRVVYQPQG